MPILDNIKKIKSDITENVTLIAVVKYATLEQIKEAINSGIKDIGFNTYQQLRDTQNQIPNDVRIHFIGHLQKNKVKKVLETGIFLVQSVDSMDLAKKMNAVCNELKIKQDILIQVNSDKNKKYGFDLAELEKATIKIENSFKNLKIKGVMTIPPLTKNSEAQKKIFSAMKKIYDDLAEKHDGIVFLSMGMSDDYKIAVKEGANMIRIGTGIFK